MEIKNKPRFIIGIDPDIDKSGFAVLDKSTREVAAGAHPFPMLITMLSHYREVKGDVVVVVEAGWKNAITNYHGGYGGVAQKIALNVGRNQQVGHCIVELCRAWGLEVVEKAPLRKMWRGKDRKITHEEIAAFIPNFPKRSNSEMRDAALIAWDYAGYPIMSNDYFHFGNSRRNIKKIKDNGKETKETNRVAEEME